MTLPSFTTLSALLLASEVGLAVAKRSKVRAGGKDRSTLLLLWLVICASIFAGFFLRAAFPLASLPHPRFFYVAGLVLFILGLIIRWIAIIYLGRFFTVNVAIAEDHELITTGPYRYVRHPS
ncbi:MAG: isoprenylcysteine carboxylmethyltransferase family protein, partial [Chthoniobacterales bacterium]